MYILGQQMRRVMRTFILHGTITMPQRKRSMSKQVSNPKKIDNLRKKENIYFCIDDPNIPYKGVRGKGSVKGHEDVNLNVPIVEKMHIRYLGTLEHPISRELISAVIKGQSVVLEISPKYYSTWDYSKQGLLLSYRALIFSRANFHNSKIPYFSVADSHTSLVLPSTDMGMHTNDIFLNDIPVNLLCHCHSSSISRNPYCNRFIF